MTTKIRTCENCCINPCNKVAVTDNYCDNHIFVDDTYKLRNVISKVTIGNGPTTLNTLELFKHWM